MDILRGIAYPLIAAPFVVDGASAAFNPEPHAEMLVKACRRTEKVGLPRPSMPQARLLARASGAATALLGSYLVFGKRKRTAALLLAVNMAPAVFVNVAAADPRQAKKDAPENKEARSLLRQLNRTKALAYGASFGGVLLASVDRRGEPSLAWKRAYARQERVLLRAAEEGALEGAALAAQKTTGRRRSATALKA